MCVACMLDSFVSHVVWAVRQPFRFLAPVARLHRAHTFLIHRAKRTERTVYQSEYKYATEWESGVMGYTIPVPLVPFILDALCTLCSIRSTFWRHFFFGWGGGVRTNTDQEQMLAMEWVYFPISVG